MPRLLLSVLLPAVWAAAQEPEMAPIPGGECPIGAGVSHEGAHKPKIDAFRIATFPVTNAEYQRFVEAAGHPAPKTSSFDSRHRLWDQLAGIQRQPVVNVSWHDAVAYCAWLAKSSGKPYRLPSEEEWELAARGGLKGKKYPWGDSIDKSMAWYGQKWKGPLTLREAGYGKPNDYGLYGMAGNVWQWTADWFVPEFNGRPVEEESRLYRVLRGGSWSNDENFLTVNYRNFNPPDTRDVFTGFRVALTEGK